MPQITSSAVDSGRARLGLARPGEAAETVLLVTLDGFAAREDLARLELLKIDVEGHERAVLAGGARTILRWHPVIVIETGHEAPDDRTAIRAQLGGAGYELAGILLDYGVAAAGWEAYEAGTAPFAPGEVHNLLLLPPRADMAGRALIVSGADDGYFPLLADLVLSIRRNPRGAGAAIAFSISVSARAPGAGSKSDRWRSPRRAGISTSPVATRRRRSAGRRSRGPSCRAISRLRDLSLDRCRCLGAGVVGRRDAARRGRQRQARDLSEIDRSYKRHYKRPKLFGMTLQWHCYARPMAGASPIGWGAIRCSIAASSRCAATRRIGRSGPRRWPRR